ncbi:MAG: ribonucleoside triphosphate reductase [Candidatus Thermoplasmatota archaeon]|nr:ribonucleoside triphosphate reductase [Candidatus Thermoplasmatota archaeon]
MIRKIRKRDGEVVDFNPVRITNAVWEASSAVGNKDLELAQEVTERVVKKLEEETGYADMPSVEKVQDLVEETLMEIGEYKLAKAYILYRKQHEEIRKVGGLLEDIEMVDEYLDRADWKVKENSNMSYSLQGLNVYTSETVIENYWLNKIYPPEIRDAHMDGDFHIHDLGTLGPYCVGWDLKDILLKGFRGVSGKIASSPPKHLSAAMMQIVNFLYTLQGEAAGAQAISSFDTLLAPFIHYDGLDYDEVKQQMQMFLFNMNVPTRVGFQTPFTNITMDLNPPEHMRDEPVIIGGDLKEETYGEFREEMIMINRAFSEVMQEGDDNSRPFTFPIPTYNITEDFDWDDERYDPLWEMTANYGIPYFSNYVNSEMNPEDSRSMCCRLRLDNRELNKRGGGLFGANPKTGSIGVVTINLPRIGYKARNEEEFLETLDSLMDKAKKSLEIKREVIESLTKTGLHPYSRFYLSDVQERFGEFWKNHFSTIGLVGMNDAVLNLLGEDIGSNEGIRFAEKVLSHMRDRLKEYQEKTGNLFNLEATPAESTCYRLAKLDEKRYPDIKIHNKIKSNGEKEIKPYYTNSSQLPVGYTEDLFEALNLQEPLQTKYTGGTVFHGFIGESMPSPTATKKLVKKISEVSSIPYYTITPTFSICSDHGYISGKHEFCPKCEEGDKKRCEIYSRVVGYLRPVNQWNEGKTQEFEDRETFEVKAVS